MLTYLFFIAKSTVTENKKKVKEITVRTLSKQLHFWVSYHEHSMVALKFLFCVRCECLFIVCTTVILCGLGRHEQDFATNKNKGVCFSDGKPSSKTGLQQQTALCLNN